MAATAQTIKVTYGLAPHERNRPRATTGEEGAAPSPALMLQQALDAEIGAGADAPSRKWSRRTRLVFILATCGGFWAAVAIGLMFVLR